MAKTGLLMMLSEKLGKSISEIKSAIMKAATGVYKRIKAELGVARAPREAYFEVLRAALPIAWDIVRSQHRLPTVDEVYKLTLEEHPDLIEKVKAIIAAKTGEKARKAAVMA